MNLDEGDRETGMADSKPDVDQEREWIDRCRRGEREAFEPLVERYRRRVFSVVFHIVRRADQVEDLAQEIFIKAYVGIRSYNFQSSFGTWLARIAVNHCYDYLRRERASRVKYYWQMQEDKPRELEARLEDPGTAELDSERRAELRDLVGKLLERAPVQDRILLVLKELEDLSVEEIAQVLKIRPGTVKVRLHRARKRMLADLIRWKQGI